MSYVDEVIERVVKENPNEPEFHQAVKEVLTATCPSVICRYLSIWSVCYPMGSGQRR